MKTIKHGISMLIISMLLIHTNILAQGNWAQLPDCAASGRYLSAGFALGDYGYICGGNLQGGGFTTDLLRYDPVSNFWTLKASMPFGAAAGVAFTLNSRGWFTTGYTQFGGLTELYSYNPVPDLWSVLISFPGMARNGAIAFSFPNSDIVGMGGDGFGNYYNDIYEYNFISGNWIPRANFPGNGRINSAFFTIGTKGYIITGEGVSGLLSEVWEYDQVGNSWTQKADFPGIARISSACFTIGNYGYLMGGENPSKTLLTDFWQYNPASDTWVQFPSFPGTPRKNASAFNILSKGYVVCGLNGSTALNDFWSWTPSGVGMENENFSENFEIFPNPGKGNFSIRLNGLIDKDIDLQVSDIAGRVVYMKKINQTEWNSPYIVNLEFLHDGIYLLSLSNSKVKIVKKIHIIN